MICGGIGTRIEPWMFGLLASLFGMLIGSVLMPDGSWSRFRAVQEDGSRATARPGDAGISSSPETTWITRRGRPSPGLSSPWGYLGSDGRQHVRVESEEVPRVVAVLDLDQSAVVPPVAPVRLTSSSGTPVNSLNAKRIAVTSASARR